MTADQKRQWIRENTKYNPDNWQKKGMLRGKQLDAVYLKLREKSRPSSEYTTWVHPDIQREEVKLCQGSLGF